MSPFRRLRAGLAAWLRTFATRPRFLALAAFLFAGDLKADPRLEGFPVDLTLLTGTVLTLFIVPLLYPLFEPKPPTD